MVGPNVVDPNAEVNRLRELMPASGRMKTRLLLSDRQPALITAEFPRPWRATHAVTINLALWQQLSQPQRDLLFLREVCWVTQVNLLQPSWYQALAVGGLGSAIVELVQGDGVGLLAAAGVTALAGLQLWRSIQGPKAEIAADDKAVQVAQRRGYSKVEAATALIEAIEAVPVIAGRTGLGVTDLIRCQNLRTQAGLSKLSVPESYLQP